MISENFLRLWFQHHSSHVLRDYDDSLEHYLVAALLLDEEEEADSNGRLLYHSRGELGGLEGSFRNTFS